MRRLLCRIAVQQALPDEVIRVWHWHSKRPWTPNDAENRRGDKSLFADNKEQIPVD
jgi:hypothetical protein